MSDHNDRVHECSNETLKKIMRNEEHPMKEEAEKEYKRRMNMRPDCKAIRQQKREHKAAIKAANMQHHRDYSGDVRKFRGK